MISSILGASMTMRSYAKLGKEGRSKVQEILSVITCEGPCEYLKMNISGCAQERVSKCYEIVNFGDNADEYKQ